MKEELHLFIIWENGREKQEEILEDIKSNFEIVRLYEIEWEKEKFTKNMSRFYGTKLPKDCRKETYCGNGKFLLIIIKVKNPIYEQRLTTKGEKTVNVNMFDKKTMYRELTGGGDRVHGTNDEAETNHDLTLLLGKNIKDFLKENNNLWDGKIQELKCNLFGAEKWNSVSDMFYALNNCVNYAILRNYESLPDEIYEKDHNDIDIICESLEETKYILNAKPVFEEEYRVHYKTKVEDRIAYFDLRSIGDNYYCEQMEKDILRNRIYNEKGFYTLNIENYFYTLLYHALIQKLDFRDDYKKKLIDMKIKNVAMNTSLEEYAKILKEWMLKKEYEMIKPKDKSVIFNLNNTEYFKPLIYRKDGNQAEQVEELKKENLELKETINELNKVILGMQDSRTWKLTEPIRKLKNILK